MTTHGDAFVAIHQEGGAEALKLVGDIMERNARDLDWQQEQIRSFDQRRIEQLQAENDLLWDRYVAVRSRLMWLLGFDLTELEVK